MRTIQAASKRPPTGMKTSLKSPVTAKLEKYELEEDFSLEEAAATFYGLLWFNVRLIKMTTSWERLLSGMFTLFTKRAFPGPR